MMCPIEDNSHKAQGPKQSARMKQILKWTAVGALGLLLLSGLLFGLVQTEVGKRHLALWLSSVLSKGPEVQVKLGRLHGLIPFDIRMEQVSVSDNSGEWMSLENVVFRWSPGRLLRGRLYVRQLSAGAVRLDRLPYPRKTTEKRKWALPAWPPAIPPFVLEQIAIERLYLGKAVVGEQASFRVNGHMDAVAPTVGLATALRIERTDGPKASAHISWSLRQETPVLKLDVKIKEEEGGLLSSVLGLKNAGAVSMELAGEGPLKAWKGQLTANAGRLAVLESSIGWIVQKKDIRVFAEGHVKAGPSLLPAAAVRLMGGSGFRFTLDAGYPSDRELVFHGAQFETDQARIALEGMVNLQKQSVRADFSFGVKDLSPLKGFTGSVVQGQLTGQGHLSGPLSQPQMDLSVSLQQVGVAEVHVSTFEGEFRIEPIGQLRSSFPGLIIEGKGQVNGLSHQSKDVLIPERDFRWSLAAKLPAGQPIGISRLELIGVNTTMRLSSQVNPVSQTISADAAVEIADLGKFSGLFGFELSGATKFQAGLALNVKSGSLSAKVEGRLNNLGSLPRSFTALLEPEIKYSARVQLLEAERLNISAFELQTDEAKLGGEATLDLLSEALKGRCRLRLPRLSVLSEAVGRPLSGSLEMDVEMDGVLSSPKIIARASGNGVLLEGVLLERVGATLHVQGLPERPKGDIRLEFQHRGNTFNAMSAFAMNKHELNLSDLSVKGPGAHVSGYLNLHLKSGMVEGTLEGKSDDLSVLSEFLGEELGGKARFKAQLTKGSAGQDILLDLKGNEIISRFGLLRDFGMRCQIQDILHAMEGVAAIEIKMLRKDRLGLETFSLEVEGNPKEATFSASGKGHLDENFHFQTGGTFGMSPKGQQIQLESLQGRYGEYPVTLTSPVVIRRESSRYILDGMALQLGQGRFQASGKLGTDTVLFNAQLEGLPLDMLQLIGTPGLLGSAAGRIHVTGSPDRPETNIELQFKEVRLRDAAYQKIPPGNISTKAELKEGQFRAELSLDGLTEKPVKANFQTPVTVSLLPFAFSLPSKGELQGRLSGELNLTYIPAFFTLEDQTLEGRILTELTLSGSVEDPEFRGTVQVSDASYENARVGTILKDVQILAKVKDDKLVFEKVLATDGEKGTVSAQGWLKLVPANDFPFQVDFTLNNSKLLRRDDLTATTDAHVTVSGSLKQMLLAGNLTAGPAEFLIPDRLPPEVPDLAVVEINGPVQKSKSEKDARPRMAGKLALNLTVEIPGRVFVRGRGLDSEWQGKLHITGSAREPVITGGLSVVSGHYDFLGKPFSLAEGALTFQGNVPPAPNFNVMAEGKGGDITARVRLSGTPSAFSMKLESVPPLPSDEILSRLLFGRDVTSITPVQAVKLAQAVNAMAGGGGPDFMDRTRRLLGVDQLDVKESEAGDGGPAARVGKYFTDEVYVEVEQGLGPQSGIVSVEVELTPHISVETQVSLDTDAGLGLNWKWDY